MRVKLGGEMLSNAQPVSVRDKSITSMEVRFMGRILAGWVGLALDAKQVEGVYWARRHSHIANIDSSPTEGRVRL